ncbi:MAG TPA: hypothetical protein VK638_38985 [Edaphobacter sp.]|nr:hypothetical protein [Edaphobacter sp.]
MQVVFAHSLMLIFAAALARLGWFMTLAPERASHLFTLGTKPAFGKRLAASWCRAVGWLFTIGGSRAVPFYLVLITIDFWHSRR